MKKDSVIFYYEWLPLIASLANASKLKFFEIFTNPDLRDIVIDDDPHLKCVVDFIKIKIEQNERKYEKTIEARKLAGSKGGKQKLANASKKKQKLANVADNVNENDNVNESNKVTLTNLSVNHIQDWLNKKRVAGKYVNHDEHYILEYFKNYCESKGKKYNDYIAAYRNAFAWESCQPKGNNYGTQQNNRPNHFQPAKQSITDHVNDLKAKVLRGEL